MRSRLLASCLAVVTVTTAGSAQAPSATPRGAGERRVTSAPAAPAQGRGSGRSPARPGYTPAVSMGGGARETESPSRSAERRLPHIISAAPSGPRDHRRGRRGPFPFAWCAIPPCFCSTWPLGGFLFSSAYDTPLLPAADADRPASRPRIIEGAPEAAAGGLRIEALGDSLLRLSRPAVTRPVQEVRFFVADAQQQVLAQQSITSAPFTAIFAVTPAMVFAGVETIFPDGARTAVILPLRPAEPH